MKKIITSILVLATISSTIFSCKKNSETQPPQVDNRETIINDSALVISTISDNLITTIDSSKIVFNGTNQQLDSIKQGFILASKPTNKAKYGYLRKVLSVQRSGNTLTVLTTNATIIDLFDKANATYEYEYDIADTLSRIQAVPFTINDSIILNNSNGQAKILIDFKSTPKIKNDFNVSLSNGNNFTFPKLQSWLFRLDLANELKLKATANYSNSFNLGPTKIGRTVNLKNFYFVVGGAPIVLRVELEWFIGLDGSFNSNASLEYSNKNSCFGLFWYNGSVWDKRSDLITEQNSWNTNIQANGTLKGYVQPRIRVSLYDHSAIGVGINPNIYAKLNANYVATNTTSNLNWKLFAGIDGNAFIESDVPKFLGLTDQTRIDFNNLFNKEILIKEDSIVYNVSTGLKSFFPYNGNANDNSGNNINGTVSGAIFSTDKNGNANSASEYINSLSVITYPSSILNNLSTGTVSLWFNANSGNNTLVDKTITNSVNHFQIKYVSNKIQLAINANYPTTNNIFQSNSTLTPNQWHHIAISWNGSVIKFYLDGILDRTINSSETIGNSTTLVRTGNDDASIAPLLGKLDQFRVYDRALSISEIQNLYYNYF